jgi:hypothetical protein
MNDLGEIISKNRPSLSESSKKTYISTLTNLYKKVYPEDDKIHISKFNNHEDFLNHLKEVPKNKRKSILSALVVVSSENEKYRKVMMEDIKEYADEQKENKKTENQEENWIEQEELKEIIKLHEDKANRLFKNKELNKGQMQDIQNYIILCLTSGIFVPPRRSLDYTMMKWRNYDRTKDNVYDKKDFVFNVYKTAKFYKQNVEEVPLELRKILNKWLKINPTDYLLFDTTEKPLSPVKLNQRLNKIFNGKKISVNALRHSYLTDKYKDLPSLKEMNETAEAMGHSVIQALEYVKK